MFYLQRFGLIMDETVADLRVKAVGYSFSFTKFADDRTVPITLTLDT
jgi:hypothetical protein